MTGPVRRTRRPKPRTFRDCLRDWLDAKRAEIGSRTWQDYEEKARRWVLPLLGSTPVRRLDVREVERLHAALRRRGLSPRTVRYVHQIVDHTLEHAVGRRFIPYNPARLARPALPTLSPGPRLTTAELVRFLEAAREDRLAALWFLLALTGMRPGEALGLCWDALSLRTRQIRVDGMLRVLPDGSLQRVPVADERQRRTVILPDTVIDLLRQLRDRRDRWREAAGTRWRETGLVFSSPTGEALRWPTVARLRFKPLLREAGLPDVPPYSLRHSSVRAQLEQGEDLRSIARRTGYVSLAAMLGTHWTREPGDGRGETAAGEK